MHLLIFLGAMMFLKTIAQPLPLEVGETAEALQRRRLWGHILDSFMQHLFTLRGLQKYRKQTLRS